MKSNNDNRNCREDKRREAPAVVSFSGVCAPSCSGSFHSVGDGSPINPVVLDEKPSSSLKTLSLPKYHSMIRMREKLLKKIRQLEEREVLFDDETKETFYINHEIKLKKALLEIEKSLHKYGALTDLDDDLEALLVTDYNNTSTAEVSITDTGNEYLNRKLSLIINEKISRKERVVTLSFDEIRDIMCEIRAEHGPLSGIPDPDKEWELFLNRLENVAFAVVRSHQNLITAQFLEHVDQYVSESERPLVSKLPELSSNMKELLTIGGDVLPDEVFRMEMQAAAKLELENPQSATEDDVDSIVDEESDYARENEDLDDKDLGCKSRTESLWSARCSDYAGRSREDFQLPSTCEDFATDEVYADSSVTATSRQPVNALELFAEIMFANASSNVHSSAVDSRFNSEGIVAGEHAIVSECVSSWSQNVVHGNIPTTEMINEDSQEVETQRKVVKREFCDGDNKADGGHTSNFSDDEIECLGVFTKSPEYEQTTADCAAKRRCRDVADSSTSSMSPPGTDLIPTDK